jgi:hypothetical protein
MPRLTTLSNKLVSAGAKRSPVVVKIFTGTDFTAATSTWTFSTGTLSLIASTLPYHSYGNRREPTTATNQSANKTWPLRSGPISESSIYSYQLTAVNTETSFTSTVVASTLTLLTTITETIVIFDTTSTVGLTTGTLISFANNSLGLDVGTTYYVKDVTDNSFKVGYTLTSRPIGLASTGTVLATVVGITTASSNIGYWLNGVNIYNPSSGVEAPNGYLSFPNLNYVAEYKTALRFNYDLNHDRAGGKTINNGAYAYHGYSFADAWTTGTAHIGTTGTAVTTGTAEISRISYLSTGLRNADGHSKIVGWSLDGYPIYGPYGYEQPLNNTSRVRPITSGYVIYTNSQDVPARAVDGALNTTTYPLGIFVQDYYYSGTGDLDVHNGRYCVTPEYPNGTYAYFCSVNSNTLEPSYPYVIGTVFRSIPVGSGQTVSDLTIGGGSSPKQTI